MTFRPMIAALALLLCASPAAAQVTPVAAANVVPNDGSLYTVANGQFSIAENQVVNVTSNNFTFTFVVDEKRDKFYCIVNGRSDECWPGGRVDLKKRTDPGGQYLSAQYDLELFEGFDHCFIDTVSIKNIKGAPKAATFRLDCL